jgi:hypothetical protein
MKTISFYTDDNRYMGKILLKTLTNNYLHCLSWLDGYNYLVFNNVAIHNKGLFIAFYRNLTK